MKRVRRILRYATYVVFYWMTLRVCVEALVISAGWHRLHPEWNPWVIVVDALIALIMYWLLWLDERLGGNA